MLRAIRPLARIARPSLLAATSAAVALGGVSAALAEPEPKRFELARGAAVTDAAPRAPLVATSQAGAVTESATGIAFPAQVPSPTSGRALSLAGAGVRVKFWVVKVYAVGLYFDAAKLKGQSTSELPPVADVPALVRITLAMELPREKYNDAIKEQVEPRMLEKNATADFEAFVNLSNQLPPTLAKGMAIDLHLDSGTLSLVADEQRVGTVVSSALCDALADVYMGSDPVSPTAKQAAIQGLPLI